MPPWGGGLVSPGHTPLTPDGASTRRGPTRATPPLATYGAGTCHLIRLPTEGGGPGGVPGYHPAPAPQGLGGGLRPGGAGVSGPTRGSPRTRAAVSLYAVSASPNATTASHNSVASGRLPSSRHSSSALLICTSTAAHAIVQYCRSGRSPVGLRLVHPSRLHDAPPRPRLPLRVRLTRAGIAAGEGLLTGFSPLSVTESGPPARLTGGTALRNPLTGQVIELRRSLRKL
jgi:hypothetical protein